MVSQKPSATDLIGCPVSFCHQKNPNRTEPSTRYLDRSHGSSRRRVVRSASRGRDRADRRSIIVSAFGAAAAGRFRRKGRTGQPLTVKVAMTSSMEETL